MPGNRGEYGLEKLQERKKTSWVSLGPFKRDFFYPRRLIHVKTPLWQMHLSVLLDARCTRPCLYLHYFKSCLL